MDDSGGTYSSYALTFQKENSRKIIASDFIFTRSNIVAHDYAVTFESKNNQ